MTSDLLFRSINNAITSSEEQFGVMQQRIIQFEQLLTQPHHAQSPAGQPVSTQPMVEDKLWRNNIIRSILLKQDYHTHDLYQNFSKKFYLWIEFIFPNTILHEEERCNLIDKYL